MAKVLRSGAKIIAKMSQKEAILHHFLKVFQFSLPYRGLFYFGAKSLLFATFCSLSISIVSLLVLPTHTVVMYRK